MAYGLRFTAYFPCVVGQGRFAVLDATAVQPGPTHEAAFGPTQVLSMPPNSTAGIGWGANVGISDRTRLFGAQLLLSKHCCLLALSAYALSVPQAAALASRCCAVHASNMLRMRSCYAELRSGRKGTQRVSSCSPAWPCLLSNVQPSLHVYLPFKHSTLPLTQATHPTFGVQLAVFWLL